MEPAASPTSERGSRTALAGVVFASLFVLGWWLLEQSPPVGSSDAALLRYFADPGSRRPSLIAGFYVLPFAGIAFMWFMAALRDRTLRSGGREHTVFSTVQMLAGSMIVAALFVVAATELAGVWAAEAVTDGQIDVDTARAVLALGAAMAQIILIRSSAVFVAISTTRALRAGLFPPWFARTSFVFALLLLLVTTLWRPVVLAIPAWVLGTSWFVLAERRNREEPIDA